MALNGLILDQRNNTSKNWRNILAEIMEDGIFRDGCEITFTSNSITVGGGYFIQRGAVIENDGAETIPVTPTLTDGYVRLICRVDLTKEASETGPGQVEWATDFSATSTFPALVQEDILSTGSVYEIEVVVLQITSGNITGITRQIGSAKINAALFNGKDASYYLPVISENEATLKNLNLTGGIITGAGNVLIVLRSDNGVGIANTAGTGYAPLRCGTFYAGNSISMASELYKFVNNGGNALDVLANVLYGVRFLGDNGIRVMNAAADAFATVYAANTTGSSKRYKENIREMTYEEAERIMQAVSVAFEWKKDSGWQGESYSFIAEELEKIDERFVYRNGKGEVEGILVNPIIAAQNMILKRHEEKIRKFDALAAKLVEKGVFTQEEIENL